MEKTKYQGKELFIFWLRLLGWIFTTAGIPITTFAIKFGLFEEKGYVPIYDEMGNITNKPIALNGWGIVCCLVLGWTLIQLVKELRKAQPEYSMFKQVLYGIEHRILPLAIAFITVYWLDGVLYNILYLLGTLVISQTIAIPINPLPKWRNDTKGIEDYEDLFYTLSRKISKKTSEAK